METLFKNTKINVKFKRCEEKRPYRNGYKKSHKNLY